MFCSMRPNIFLGTCEGSTQYKKWYYELIVDHVEPFLTAQACHLRVGWALTEGYSPYPGGGEGWGGNGVGDDLYSYGFDGIHLWTGEDYLPPSVPAHIPLSSSITLYSCQVEYHVRCPHPTHTFLRLEMWWAAVWIWASLASPSGLMDIPFKACLRISTWMVSFSLWSASQLGLSKSQAFNFS